MSTPPEQIFKHNTGITAEEVAEVRKMIGQPLRIQPWTLEVSVDTIRRYTNGVGDDNPLWMDEDYGAKTRYGTIVAPPTFLWAIWAPGIGVGFPGLQSLHAGTRWELMRYVKPGERIFPEAKLTSVDETVGKRAGRMLIETGETLYRTKSGELVARNISKRFRVPRRGVDKSGDSGLKYEQRSQTWTDEQLDDMERQILAQTRRGAAPLYWEDVQVDTELPTRLKGPLNLSTMITFYAGCLGTGGYRATDIAVKHRHLCLTHPELAPNNRPPEIQAERTAFAQGHHDGKVAGIIGMPGAYDNGYMRIGWCQQMITDWMGDDGFMKMIDVSIRLPNVIGDTVLVGGTVTNKRIEGGEHLVDIDIKATRQDGALSCYGTATIVLPSRG